MKRYVLLDRDGTIIFDKHYLHDPDGVELLPGAAEGLKHMMDKGFGLVVLTNQSGVGRGYFDEASVHACNSRLSSLLADHHVVIEGYYYCPHTPEDSCDCRKPAPGLAQQAVADLGFDPAEAYMIGDKAADMGIGKAIGAQTILVRTGKGSEQERKGCAQADVIVDDLKEAATVLS